MRRINTFSKVSLGLVISFLGVFFALSSVVYAGQFYPNGYDRCLANSGGRQSFRSIQYACRKAVEKSQNACASWLGPSGNSTSLTVNLYAPRGTASVALSLYGMCTDKTDTSSTMTIGNDGGSIYGYDNFTRGAPWGNVTTKTVYIDVAKFKAGASVIVRGTTKIYLRVVYVLRGHSDAGSYDYDLTTIYLTESEPEQPAVNLCQAWMPESYPNSNEWWGQTSIVVKARNTAGRFGNTMSGAWHHNNLNPTGEIGPIYAMPTDHIEWHSCYYPGVQTTAFTEVSDVNGNIVNGGADGMWQYDWSKYTYVYLPDGEENCQDHHPSVGYMELYRGYQWRVGEWQNRFQVGSALGYSAGGDYGPGQSWWRSDFERSGGRGMGTSRGGDVGSILTQAGYTGGPAYASISSYTPSHDIHDWVERWRKVGLNQWESYMNWEVVCTNSFEDDIRSASAGGTATDSATVIIPYNFKLDTGVSIGGNDIYAGETGITVNSAWVRVGTKYNNYTIAEYATVVPKAEVVLFAYVSDRSDGGGGGTISGAASCDSINSRKQCYEVKRVSFNDLNGGGSLSGSTDEVPGMAGTYNVFDASAGDYMCFVTAVNPYTSGADDATGDYAGDGMYKFGYPACQVIAKRPSFQVWGNDMYSNSSIDAAVSEKRNIFVAYGDNVQGKFAMTGGWGKNKFGSWVEEGLMLGGSASTGNLSSGAAMGNNGDWSRAYAGNNEDFYTTLSPLTISNYNAGYSVGGSGLYIYPDDDARRALIDYWVNNNYVNTASGATIVRSNAGSIGNVTVPKKNTWIYNVSGTFTVAGNVVYQDGYSNSTLRDIPKVIIYADNVNIYCGVTEVDAIIITKPGGTVNTCANAGGGDDDPARANPLKIFGMVIADNVVLGRTYGRAAWKGSGADGEQVAAEVFDFDSSILLWSEFMASSAETDTMQVVYQNEIAPRY